MSPGLHRKLTLWVTGILAAASTVAPAAAFPSAQVAAPFAPWWVATDQLTSLWSGPDSNSVAFGPVPPGTVLQVMAPQQHPRLLVWNPLTDGQAWVDAASVGPVPAPSDDELAALTSFEPWWVMTHKPADAWSSDSDDAQPQGVIPMWRYLQVVAPIRSERALVLEPRTQTHAYVDVTTLGPMDPPPSEYFAPPPPDGESIQLPGRVVRDTDWYNRPEEAIYFASDRLFHNDPITVEAAVAGTNGDLWYRIGPQAFLPLRQVRLPEPPEQSFPGRWIDADLTEPVLLTAYEDDRPIYSALAIKGTIAYQTPTGVYRVVRRVEDETMDSQTIGIPRDHPDGYYLKNVLFTQYFTWDGAAIHHNYWRSNWGYGGSKGCLGLNYDDALFFWEFASLGTAIYIR